MYYCKHCGQKLSDDSKFCTMCGSPVESQQSGEYAQGNCSSSESNSKNSGYYYSSSQEQYSSDNNTTACSSRITAFKNSKHPKAKLIVLILTLLLCFGSFYSGEILLGFIVLLQFALLLWGLFIDITNTKKGRKFLRYIAIVSACLLVVPACAVIAKDSAAPASHDNHDSIKATTEAAPTISPTATPAPTKSPDILVWPHNSLAALIPVPDSIYGSVGNSSEDELVIQVDRVNQEDFYAYIAACIDMGFSDIKYESVNSFEAAKSDGFRVNLYLSDESSMRISVLQPQYSIELTVDCIPNLFFNKYDLEVSLEYRKLSDIVHGSKSTYNLELSKGSHTLEVKRHGYKAPKGTIEINVTEGAKITYWVNCGEDAITLNQAEYTSLRPLTDTEAKVPLSASEYKYDDYKEVKDALTAAGFTNIKTKILYDIIWGWTKEGEIYSISIAGNADFAAGTVFNKNDEVIITYHLLYDDDPARIKAAAALEELQSKMDSGAGTEASDILASCDGTGYTVICTEREAIISDFNADDYIFESGTINSLDKTATLALVSKESLAIQASLEENFPQEKALRAAIVALTNAQAVDVFKSDGNTYDTSKFHTYSDLSSLFLTVSNEGTWYAINEQTWHVDNLKCAMNPYDTYMKTSMDIMWDGKNYVIPHADVTIAHEEDLDSDDPERVNQTLYESSDSNPFLIVSPSLIEEDRDSDELQDFYDEKAAIAARNAWIESQFSFWDGSHNDLEKLIKDCLNDEKSYKHIKTTYIDIADDDKLDIVNDILKDAESSHRAKIGDLLVITEFSAKNAFNATIKSTAYGLAKYKEETISLIAIE